MVRFVFLWREGQADLIAHWSLLNNGRCVRCMYVWREGEEMNRPKCSLVFSVP
jgi:hypothetical protein